MVVAVEEENEDDRHMFRSVVDLLEQKIYLILRAGINMKSFAPANSRILDNLRVALISRKLCVR